MPDQDTPYELDFDFDTREAVEREICRRVREAVANAEDRNDDLRKWHDQLYGFNVEASNRVWANACNLASPMSMKAFLTLMAQIQGALHRDPLVSVESFSKDTEEDAKTIEAWLAVEVSRSDIAKHLYDLAHYACWSPACVAYVGWVQETRTSREVGYKKPGDTRIYADEEREDDIEYEEVPVAEEVTEERFDIRAVPLRDFYLYPATAKSIERATAVCERMSLTAEELYAGIDTYGYDKEAVEDLIRQGINSNDNDQEEQDSQHGLNATMGKDGFFDIYTVYTRMPYFEDVDVPEHLRGDDFIVVCAPDANLVLKMAFSPFKNERPYFLGSILPDPDSYMGTAMMLVLEPMQAEANGNIQFGIDNSNLTMSPCLIGPKSLDPEAEKFVVQPGAVWRTDDYDRIKPLEWDRANTQDMLAKDQWLNNQADSVVSAQGQGQLSGKVRKQGEIDNIQQQTSAKFGMYLSNFQRTVVAELFRRLVALKMQFGDVDDDGEEFMDTEGHAQKLTSRALKGKYQIVAAGTSLTHSPEALIEVNTKLQAVQAEYLKAAMAGMPPKFLKLLWHGAREQINALGQRNAEAWIGDEPEEQPQQAEQPPQPHQQQMQPMNGNGHMPQMPMPQGVQ